MTHPTKAIYKWLLADYVKVSGVSGGGVAEDDQLYTEADLMRSYERIIPIDYHQEVEHAGIKFTALNAGHVLGAAMFLIEIAGVTLLYTGDYSREEDRHLMAAETPEERPDVLVCESTYGVHSHQPRLERERRFTSLVHNVVGRGGRCLLPVFALGRAQELLLILDEYWQAHPELHRVPIYYASALAKRCLTIYQTYVNMMNERIRRQISISNPFIFKHVSNLRSMESFSDAGPCVILASPAMLQHGLSRDLLERWCSSPKNGLIIPGYVVEGTLAKQLLTEPKEIIALSGATLPMRMSVEYISFSAHVDFGQNSEFIDLLKPPHLVLVHGEANEMLRLKSALQHRYGISSTNTQVHTIGGAKPESIMYIHTPRNCESVELTCRGEKAIKIVGSLAMEAKKANKGAPIEGILVGKDFEYQLIAKEDLSEYTPALKEIKLIEKQVILSRAPFSLIEFLATQVYGKKSVTKAKGDNAADEIIVVNGKSKINVRRVMEQKDTIEIEWEGNPMADLLADSLAMLIMGAESSRAAVKATKTSSDHKHHDNHRHNDDGRLSPEKEKNIMKSYLENHYGPIGFSSIDDEECFSFDVDGYKVSVLISDYSVICEDRTVFDRISSTLSSIVGMLDPDYII